MQSTKAQQIAETLTKTAREMGANDVIVMVSIDAERGDAEYFTAWSGRGLAIRGLLELGAERVRSLFTMLGVKGAG